MPRKRRQSSPKECENKRARRVKEEKKEDTSSDGSPSRIIDDPENNIAENIPESPIVSDDLSSSTSVTPTSTDKKNKRSYPKYSQIRSENIIIALNGRLSALKEAQNSMPSDEIFSQITKTQQDLEQERKRLKRLQQLAEAQRKCREDKKAKLAALSEKIPEAQTFLKKRPVGRPSLEDDQPLLHKTIMDIAMFGSVRDGPSGVVRSIKSLSKLHEELGRQGFILSRSSTYLRLLPKSLKTSEGKRHVRTVPVKLSSDHHQHIDELFAKASIRYLEGLASVLGPQQVVFLSQEARARVPIDLTSADKEAPLLMHLDFVESDLPEEESINAKKHQLIPFVYAGMVIDPNELDESKAVGQSGPTYVAIRSERHSSASPASSHARDFETLLGLDSFQNIAKTKEGKVKPVVIITTTDGPDESPRHPEVIINAIKHFMTHDLDALFIATNAPGRSACNRVEKIFVPLSRELEGLILPHDVYGSHLNDEGQTVDALLEERNFQNAGETLAQVWSEVSIDHFPLTARYIHPNKEVDSFPFLSLEHDPNWYKDHVRESEYFLQIVKCQVDDCCGKFRSGLLKLLPQRFLPPPVRVTQSADDLIVAKKKGHFLDLPTRRALDLPLNEDNKYLQVPYDLFCPSVENQLEERICRDCGLYFASQESMKMHSQIHPSTSDESNAVEEPSLDRNSISDNKEEIVELQSPTSPLEAINDAE